jgi:hypothetical protein
MKRLLASAAIVAVAAIGIPVATAATASATSGVKITPKRLICPTLFAGAGPVTCGSIMVQNTGTTTINTGIPEVAGDTTVFSLTHSCDFFTLPFGAACSMPISFMPITAGRFSMTITILDNVGGVLGKAAVVGRAT